MFIFSVVFCTRATCRYLLINATKNILLIRGKPEMVGASGIAQRHRPYISPLQQSSKYALKSRSLTSMPPSAVWRQRAKSDDIESIVTVERRSRCRAPSTRDLSPMNNGQMLIVVNKESCMLLLQRRAEPRKRLHLYQPCAKRKHTWNLWPFHRR